MLGNYIIVIDPSVIISLYTCFHTHVYVHIHIHTYVFSTIYIYVQYMYMHMCLKWWMKTCLCILYNHTFFFRFLSLFNTFRFRRSIVITIRYVLVCSSVLIRFYSLKRFLAAHLQQAIKHRENGDRKFAREFFLMSFCLGKYDEFFSRKR